MTEKYAKGPGTGKASHSLLCSEKFSSFVARLPQPASVQFSGTKQLAFHALTATLISTAQTYFVLFPQLERRFVHSFNSAGFLFKVTPANKQYQ